MSTLDPRPTLDAPDLDPHRWLEDIDGAAAVAWVRTQNQSTLDALGGPAFDADVAQLTALLDRPDRIAFIRRRGGFVYNFWRDAAHPRGLWRRTTLGSYETGAPDWDVLIDVDALSAADDEDWTWKGAETLPPDHSRALVWLSPGGGDAISLREFNFDTRAFVRDGFSLPAAKGAATWLDADHLLLSAVHAGGSETTSGYARTTRLWRRGTPAADAPTIFEVPAEHIATWAYHDRTVDQERVWFLDRSGFFDAQWSIGDRTGPKTTLDLPSDASIDAAFGWLAIKLRSDWSVGGRTYPSGAVLGADLDAYLAGDRTLRVLFEPGDRRAIQSMFWAGRRLIAMALDALRPRVLVWRPEHDWSEEAFPEQPPISDVSVGVFDAETEESDGSIMVVTQTPTRPTTLALAPLGAPARILAQLPEMFSADGLVVERHEAEAADGERIPYVQVGPKGPPTGDAPVHLSGYGGFAIPITPRYDAELGALWLARGGTTVTANIRGGGEFGAAWHDAGRGRNKIQSHDDFAAVAADLVARGVTRPGRIAAEGGSNGGLLIANMLTRWPERFGALFCTVPLIDMRSYAALLAGASWIDEYGDPSKPDDWAHLGKISAYHLAAPHQPYPPILIATTRRDDRVHPGHARKMTAKLQAMGYGARYYELDGGGHGYGSTNADRAQFTALGLRFLADAIGWRSA